MCFMPKIPKPSPLPTPPSIDQDAVEFRRRKEQERLFALGGTTGDIRTEERRDFVPGSGGDALGNSSGGANGAGGFKRVLLGV